jgi:selenocysteine lyase/cysteine desulfurase
MNSAEWRADFEPLGEQIWLNTAHQGVLPLPAAAEAREAIAWKTRPYELTQERFQGTPTRLRSSLAHLIGANPDEIVLANSVSYGLHLIAHGYPWRRGDEVLVTEGDFPSDILPWLVAERRYGIKVVRIRPRQYVVQPDELTAAITAKTRMFCSTWAHSFSGFVADAAALGSVCHDQGVTFVLNASQAIGARSLRVSAINVDAVVCAGFKWLCGPYGTGFCWLSPALTGQLRVVQSYWLASQTAESLELEVPEVELREDLDAKGLDVFGTANFFNFKPFAAAVELIDRYGVDRIAAHDQNLVEHFVSSLDKREYRLISPREQSPSRSTLVLFSCHERARNQSILQRLNAAGIHVAYRAGSIRLSPHCYNTVQDIDRTLESL